MTRRILVVDDEPSIRELLRAYLQADGFEVTLAGTGADALHEATESAEPPDLVLLDIGLPDLDGLEVLRMLRRTSDVYVILVTARAEEVDRIIGLSGGADDYVTKPFSPREVVARVRTVLRRSRAAEAEDPSDGGRGGPLTFAGLTIDEARREIRRYGAPVTLSALEFDLFARPRPLTGTGLLPRPAPRGGLGVRLLRRRAGRRRARAEHSERPRRRCRCSRAHRHRPRGRLQVHRGAVISGLGP